MKCCPALSDMQGERSVLAQKEKIFLSACKFSYQTDQQKLLGGGKEEVAEGWGWEVL